MFWIIETSKQQFKIEKFPFLSDYSIKFPLRVCITFIYLEQGNSLHVDGYECMHAYSFTYGPHHVYARFESN